MRPLISFLEIEHEEEVCSICLCDKGGYRWAPGLPERGLDPELIEDED